MNRHCFKYVCNAQQFDYTAFCDTLLDGLKNFIEHCEFEKHLDIVIIDIRSYVVNMIRPCIEVEGKLV